MSSSTTEYLGPLVRLSGISTAQLPSESVSSSDLTPFIHALLAESIPFIDSATSQTQTDLWKSKGSKSTPCGTVQLSERVISTADLNSARSEPLPPTSSSSLPSSAAAAAANDGTTSSTPATTTTTTTTSKTKSDSPETWACRISNHADAARQGTASWAEFVDCIRDRHAETEDLFTPTALDHHEAVSWRDAARGAEAFIEEEKEGGSGGEGGEVEAGKRWGEFTMQVVEMKHKVPSPLNNRVFTVMQVTASVLAGTAVAAAAAASSDGAKDSHEFIVVSIPINDFSTASPHAKLSKEKNVVLGAYAAIERVRKLPGTGEIEWVMATASDAGGVLPLWVQTRAIPGQIAKDVRFFIDWIGKEREKKATGKGGDIGAQVDGAEPGSNTSGNAIGGAATGEQSAFAAAHVAEKENKDDEDGSAIAEQQQQQQHQHHGRRGEINIGPIPGGVSMTGMPGGGPDLGRIGI